MPGFGKNSHVFKMLSVALMKQVISEYTEENSKIEYGIFAFMFSRICME